MILSILLIASLNRQPIRFDPRVFCKTTFVQSHNLSTRRENAKNKLCKPIVPRKPQVVLRKPIRSNREK